MILYVLLTLTLLCLRQSFSIKFENKNDTTGITFMKLANGSISHDNWNVCFYYELKEYFDQINLFEESVEQLQKICNFVDEKEKLCSTLLNKIRIYNNKTEHRNHLINTKYAKPKRNAPLSPVGKIYSIIFGVLNEDHAEFYNEKINQIQNNAELNNELINQHISIIQESFNLNQEMFSEFNHRINDLFTEIIELKNDTSINTKRILINENINFFDSYGSNIND